MLNWCWCQISHITIHNIASVRVCHVFNKPFFLPGIMSLLSRNLDIFNLMFSLKQMSPTTYFTTSSNSWKHRFPFVHMAATFRFFFWQLLHYADSIWLLTLPFVLSSKQTPAVSGFGDRWLAFESCRGVLPHKRCHFQHICVWVLKCSFGW